MQGIGRTPKAALPIGGGSLHPDCASFPWHTGALVEGSRQYLSQGAFHRQCWSSRPSMRARVTAGALLVFCAILAGCQIGGSPGVLPRTAVPLPQSMTGPSNEGPQTATPPATETPSEGAAKALVRKIRPPYPNDRSLSCFVISSVESFLSRPATIMALRRRFARSFEACKADL